MGLIAFSMLIFFAMTFPFPIIESFSTIFTGSVSGGQVRPFFSTNRGRPIPSIAIRLNIYNQATSRSNFFQRYTTGAELISLIPLRIRSLSSSLLETRI